MATKYQDSTPKSVIWEVGKDNKPHQWTAWGYDVALVAFKPEDGIKAGEIIFEGYLGFVEPEGSSWGDWYRISATDVLTGELSSSYMPNLGSSAFWIKLVGFSQFRVREHPDVKMSGSGKLQVGFCLHSGM